MALSLIVTAGAKGSDAAWVIGYAGGALLAGLVVWLTGKKRPRQYDERQIAARGEAFRAGFIVLAVYETVYALLSGLGVRYADEMAGPLVGIILSAAVFAVFAIARDAYDALGQKKTSVWFWFGCGLLWIGVGAMRVTSGDAVRDGLLTVSALPLFLGVAVLAVGAAVLIHDRQKNREDDGDGE